MKQATHKQSPTQPRILRTRRAIVLRPRYAPPTYIPAGTSLVVETSGGRYATCKRIGGVSRFQVERADLF